MFVVQPIRYRQKVLVPAALASLISPDEQNCSSARIESEQHAVGPSSMLNPQLLHIGVLRGRYRVHVGPTQGRAEAPKQIHACPYIFLLGLCQPDPPHTKLIGVLYFPFLPRNIPPKACQVNSACRECCRFRLTRQHKYGTYEP